MVEITIASSTKITVKPRTNPSAAVTRRAREAVGEALSVVMPIPLKMLKYEGISGKTQGERNESSPATNARNSETFDTIHSIFPRYVICVNHALKRKLGLDKKIKRDCTKS